MLQLMGMLSWSAQALLMTILAAAFVDFMADQMWGYDTPPMHCCRWKLHSWHHNTRSHCCRMHLLGLSQG